LPALITNQPKKLKLKNVVPKLELLKAKQIQEIIVKNMCEDDKANKLAPPSNKDLNKIKDLNLTLKKSLNREILRNVELEKKADHLSRHIMELEQRNALLVRSTSKGQSLPMKQEQ
jgi:hypothetical protein